MGCHQHILGRPQNNVDLGGGQGVVHQSHDSVAALDLRREEAAKEDCDRTNTALADSERWYALPIGCTKVSCLHSKGENATHTEGD